MIWGFSGIVVCCFRPHLTLTRQVVFICFTLLPCLTTFNIVGYINGIKLNNLLWCSVNMHLVAYCAPLNLQYCLLHFAMLCLIKPDMHHTRLCIMTCLCLCVYYVVCFFPGCFSRQLRFRSGVVRIRSSTAVCLLHGLILLPCGISGKMIIPSKSLLSLLCQFARSFAMPML